MPMKKVSIVNQIGVPRSTMESVMRHNLLHHRGVSTTLEEIKQRCYWPNCALDMAQKVCQCSIFLEKQRVDLHNGEAFKRCTTRVWENVHVDLIGSFSALAEDKYRYILMMLYSYSQHIQVISLEDKQ